MSADFELLVDRQAFYGAGVFWRPALNCLYWVDIFRRELHAYDRMSGVDEVTVFPQLLTAVASTATGQLVGAYERGFARLYPGRAAAEPITQVGQGSRMAAGLCDHAGRFVAASVASAHGDAVSSSALHLLSSGKVKLLVEGFSEITGLAFNPGGSVLYVVDSVERTVWAYEYDSDQGRVGRARLWLSFTESEGQPHGVAVDAWGGVWITLQWTGRIQRHMPNGALDVVLGAPTRRVTSLAFGGRRLEELYVSSACYGYSERELLTDPHAGGLFRTVPGIPGVPITAWQGL